MIVPQVSAELMMIARSVAARPGRIDIIKTILKEHPHVDFDAVYGATQRLSAFAYTLANSEVFDPWITPPVSGEIYSDISPDIWHAVATARLERDDDDLYTHARFDLDELRKALALECKDAPYAQTMFDANDLRSSVRWKALN